MLSLDELLRALPPSKRGVWLNSVGAALAASRPTERRAIILARKCILHAFAVNQRYFAARVRADALVPFEQVLATIEDVTAASEFPAGDVDEMAHALMPAPDSASEIVPGWVALLGALGPFLSYRNERNPESLNWAIACAYQSVANRACAELRGVDGNCGFNDDEKEVEQGNETCAKEIEYQLAQLAVGA